MENEIERRCGSCGNIVKLAVREDAEEQRAVSCPSCGQPIATVGELHAQVAQEALGLGATDLRDDHVPVGGAIGEQPGQ